MNKHKGKKRMQKRPNYKNVGEEEDEERGPTEDAQEDAEKTKGTEGGSKSMKTSGEREGECTRELPLHPRQPLQPARLCVLCLYSAPHMFPGCSCSPQHQFSPAGTAWPFRDSCGMCHNRSSASPTSYGLKQGKK